MIWPVVALDTSTLSMVTKGKVNRPPTTGTLRTKGMIYCWLSPVLFSGIDLQTNELRAATNGKVNRPSLQKPGANGFFLGQALKASRNAS
jgi:hypothetical protein